MEQRMATACACLDSSSVRVGWIGMGTMGLPMCSHLQAAGFPITIFCRSPHQAEALSDKGAVLVDSPTAVAQRSNVVFTILGNTNDVREVVLGANGLLQGFLPGSILVDSTSVEPSLSRKIFDSARAIGCDAVDAPVSGNDVGARLGTLSFMAGGNEETVKKLEPLFKRMGTVTYIGPAGAGQSCKLANQITGAPIFMGLVEGLLFAHKSGLDLSIYLKAVSGGAAGSRIMDHFASRLLKRDFAPGGMVKYLLKDLRAASKESERMGAALPGVALLEQLMLSLKAHGDEEEGIQALLLTLERLNKVSLSDTS